MRKTLIKAIITPSMVAGAIIPLSLIASTKTTEFDNILLSKPSDDKPDKITTNIDDSGKKRHIIVDDSQSPTYVISTMTEFYTDDLISKLNFTLKTDDIRYSITGLEKIVMGGKTLVEDTDYTIDIDEYGDAEIQFLGEGKAENFYTIYIFPNVDLKTFSCKLEGESQPRDPLAEPIPNTDIVDVSIFGKIAYHESFIIRLQFKENQWNEGWSFNPEAANPITIYIPGESQLKDTDYSYTIDPNSQYVDITVREGLNIYGTVHVQPSDNFIQNESRQDPTLTFDLNIYAEGTLLQTLKNVITHDEKEPEFTLSISTIDPDNRRKFDVYNTETNYVKMNIGTVEEPVWESLKSKYTFDKNTHKIKFDLNGISFLGDIHLDLDIQLKSGNAQQNFGNDSWKEIDTLEQFFSNDPNGDNSDGFARCYGLESLSDFVKDGVNNPFVKTIIYSDHGEWQQPVRLVSVNQMPLAENKDDITIPSEKKAYFTFMSDRCLWNGHVDDPISYTDYDAYFERQKFQPYVAAYDHNGNCWYRTNPPTSWGKSSPIRNFMRGGFVKGLNPNLNGNFTSYVKPIANRVVTQSANKTSDFPTNYINDTFFIPTITQLGFKHMDYKGWGDPVMEIEKYPGERVFDIYKGKEYGKEGSEVLGREVLCDPDPMWRKYPYWTATPASNDSGGAASEYCTVIIWDGSLRSDVQTHDNNAIVWCFCI